MAKFDIDFTKRLPPGFGPNVRANLDVRTGAGAIGRALQQAGDNLAQLGVGLMNKRKQMSDGRARAELSGILELDRQQHNNLRITEADPDRLQEDINNRETAFRERLAFWKLPAEQNDVWAIKGGNHYKLLNAKDLGFFASRDKEATTKLLGQQITDAVATGDQELVNDALNNFAKTFDGIISPANQKILVRAALKAGQTAKNDRIANTLVQTALGATIVEKGGKDVMLPASVGLDLINAIDAPLGVKTRARTEFTTQYNIRQREAEKQTDAAQESDLLDFTKRIYSNVHISNEEIFASSLDAAQIKFIKTLQSAETRTKPGEGSPFANMEAMSINIQLGEGLITKKDAMVRLLPLLEDVDPDRVEPLLADFTKKFGMARSNVFSLAQKSSKTLISKIFADATTALEFEKLFLGASATDKAKLNRQFVAEWTNRNQYNVAFREWVEEHPDATLKEMSTAADFILLNYQKRQQLDLEAFEREITIERNFRLRPPVTIAPAQLKAIKDMTENEKRAELLRLQQGR